MRTVTIYSKPGCCLCDDAKQLVDDVRRRFTGKPFAVDVRNILEDAKAFAEHQFAIPVVFVDGVEIARYRLTEAQLVDALVRPTT